MAQTTKNPQFQDVVEAVEALPLDDQSVLVDLIRQRIAEQERERVLADVAEARADYREGAVTRGTAKELLAEIGE